MVLIKKIKRYGESRFPSRKPSGKKLPLRPSAIYNKLLGRGVFRIMSNIQDKAFFAKTVNGFRTLTVFAKKAPSQMFDWVPNAPLLGGCCKCGVKVDYECMEFVVAGWYSRKYQRLDETKEILW